MVTINYRAVNVLDWYAEQHRQEMEIDHFNPVTGKLDELPLSVALTADKASSPTISLEAT